MNAYDLVHKIFHYYFESVDCQSIKVLMQENHEYKKIQEELTEISEIPWFTNFLNEKLTEPITQEQAKTIVRYMNLQSILDYDLKVMFYLNGLKDASALEHICKQLNE